MKKFLIGFLIGIFVLGIAIPTYSDEVLSGFDEETDLPVLTELLRKLRKDINSVKDSSYKHYRKGLTLKNGTTADEDIKIRPGVIDIGGVLLTATADSSDLDVGTETFLAGSTGTDQYIYIYVWNDSKSIAYRLSTEAPDLSDTDDKTAEFPMRYQKYSTTYYRCVGAVYQDAAGDLCWGQATSEGLFVTNFDASNCMVINGLGDDGDQTFNTIWTPKWVKVIYGQLNTTPASGEVASEFTTAKLMLDTNWYGTALGINHAGATFQWNDLNQAGIVNAITEQTASATGAGRFTIDAMGNDKLFYAIAWTDEL